MLYIVPLIIIEKYATVFHLKFIIRFGILEMETIKIERTKMLFKNLNKNMKIFI